MLEFDKQMHDFGIVKLGSKQETTFTYKGDLVLLQSDFQTNCTCTAGTYNQETKTYTVGLKSDTLGLKQTSVRVKDTFLVLKMQVIE